MVRGETEGKELVESKEWYVAAYAPDSVPTSDHLKIRTVERSIAVDSIPDKHVAVETLLISVEPYIRSLFIGSDGGLGLPQIPINEGIRACGIARVIRSRDENYKEGDVVLVFFLPIAEYSILPSQIISRKLDPMDGIALTDYLSLLGVPGFAAYVGLQVIGDAKEGDNVFISAAAGAVGSCAGQLAKLKGCRVIGSTGSDEKVQLLKEEFGYDEAFNYRTEEDFDAALSKYFPNGIDIYLDNVGGKMLEAVLNHVNKKARIPICGMISQYNKVWTEREGVRNLLNIVGKDVRMQGYMMGSYLDQFGDFSEKMKGYIKQGMIKGKYQIYHGIESFHPSLASLFTSSNLGKVVLQLKD